MRRVITYGIRVGSTHDLESLKISLTWFDYTIANQVDCVYVGNHG